MASTLDAMKQGYPGPPESGRSGPPTTGSSVALPPCSHAFEPRYDEYEAGGVSKKVYVRDVCPKCGATVERDQPEA
jgi:hypothetical protein